MDKNYDSSMEELTQEEMRMLASMKRQEPQGEEHVAAGIGPKSSCPQSQVTAGTSVTCDPTSAKLTELVSSGSSTSSQYSSEGEDAVGGGHDDHHNIARRRHHRNLKKAPQSYGRQKQGNPNNVSSDSTNSHSAYNTLIIHQNNSSLLADTWIPAAHEFTSYGIGNRRREHDESLSKTQRPAHSYSNPYENIIADESGNHNSNSAFTSSELSEIPRDYLNQLTVLKHLAKEVKQDPISGTSGTSLLRSASFSKSQPDLTQTGGGARVQKMEDPNHLKSQQPPQSGNVRRKKKQSSDNVADTAQESSSYASNQGQGHAMPQQRSQTQQDDVLPSVQILEILMRENAALNAELVNAKRKVSTIHKLESELDRLQASHEALFASAERRESLERTARAKLNTELKRLTAVNRELLSSGSLQNLSPSPYASSTSDIELLKKEIAKRDYTIAQLLAQNKDIATAKERQDIELSAQRATLAEQRTHIEILDRALTNAQANVLRLEEECRKKQEFVDKSSQLQRPLEWKVKDLESRLMEKDAMIRILQTVPASSPSPMYSSASASGIPSYRDSPGYCQASSSPCHPSSASLAAMMSDPPCSMLYSPKGGSEPPSYANLPLKLRLGGSGSSLVKNSNESLQLGGSGPNTGGNSPNISGPGSVCSGSGAKLSIDEQLKELDNQILSKDSLIQALRSEKEKYPTHYWKV